jgi:hypothetical protein
VKLFERAIRPPDDITPNPNDPVSVPPSTVGPDQLVTPGDPHGVTIDAIDNPGWFPPRILPSAWSGWPAEWWPPAWGGYPPSDLTDTAWMCLDLNASVLAAMPPYLVGAADSLSTDWMRNPDPDLYSSWEEFAKQLFWDYQLGEAFVLATAYYATGWPARFHVCPPWTVNVELGRDGLRRYTIGGLDVTLDILHLRYQGSVSDAHGHGPLEAGRYRMVAAGVLIRYASTVAQGIPPAVLTHPEELAPEQAAKLQADWVAARMSRIGEPAVLSGGITWQGTQMSPEDMSLTALLDGHERRIAALLGVPAILVGIPSGGDSMTYSNVSMLLDFHWRAGLRPKAQIVMPGLSEWLLPRGTRIELNRDAYIEPEPLERARTAQILNSIVDADGTPVLSVQQIQEAERLSNSSPADLSSGVLR